MQIHRGARDAEMSMNVLGFIRRAGILPAVLLCATVLPLLACGRIGLARKYYLSSCPATGPDPSSGFAIHALDFDLERHYAALRAVGPPLQLSERARIEHEGRAYPIYLVQRPGRAGAPAVLIGDGIHGNEVAGTLAIPSLLEWLVSTDPALDRWNIFLLTPLNPVGLAFGSRYNGDGCDINRDFRRFRTAEARVVRDVLDEADPQAILSLHEGPQDGFMVVVTRAGEPRPARAMVDALRAEGLAVSSKSFLGFSLDVPGLWHEGRFVTLLKRLIRLGSLGTYANERGVGTYTTETAAGSADAGGRLRSHVVAVEAFLRAAQAEESPAAKR